MKAREHLTAPGTQITLSFMHKQRIGGGEEERDGRLWPPPKIPEWGKISIMVIIWEGHKNASFFPPLFSHPQISLEISQWLCLVSHSWAPLFFCLFWSLYLSVSDSVILSSLLSPSEAMCWSIFFLPSCFYMCLCLCLCLSDSLWLSLFPYLALPLSLTQFASMFLFLQFSVALSLPLSLWPSPCYVPHTLSFPPSLFHPFCSTLFFPSYVRTPGKDSEAGTQVQRSWEAILPHWTIMVQDHRHSMGSLSRPDTPSPQTFWSHHIYASGPAS